MVALHDLAQHLGQTPRLGQERTRVAVVHAELRLLLSPDVRLGVVRRQGQLRVLSGMRRQEAHAAEIVHDAGDVGEVVGDSEGPVRGAPCIMLRIASVVASDFVRSIPRSPMARAGLVIPPRQPNKGEFASPRSSDAMAGSDSTRLATLSILTSSRSNSRSRLMTTGANGGNFASGPNSTVSTWPLSSNSAPLISFWF